MEIDEFMLNVVIEREPCQLSGPSSVCLGPKKTRKNQQLDAVKRVSDQRLYSHTEQDESVSGHLASFHVIKL